jgi:hypothetical protein
MDKYSEEQKQLAKVNKKVESLAVLNNMFEL